MDGHVPETGGRSSTAQLAESVPKKRGARVGLFIVLAAGVAFAGVLGVRVKQAVAKRDAVANERAATAEKQKIRVPVRTVHGTPMRWMPRVDLTGTLKPWREADVGFETQGRLVKIGVATGDVVSEGQVLAFLDASRAAAQVGQAESQVKAAQASLALAQDNLKRTEALAAQKAVPEAQVEQARQQVALARAQLEGAGAGAQLAKTGAGLHSVRAPFAGIVTRAPTGIGAVVNPGAPLVHLEDTSRFRLSATVGEEDVSLVKVGAKVQVLYRERVAEGKVIAIVPSLDQATRRAPVEIEVANDGHLLAWGFVRARITGTGEVDALRLPALARRPGSQDEIVKVENGRAKLVKASFNVDEDGSLMVTSGIAAGDEILVSPSVDLRDGDPVEAAERSNAGANGK